MSLREAEQEGRRERGVLGAEDPRREEGAAVSMSARVAVVPGSSFFENRAGVLLGLVGKRIDVQLGRLAGRTKNVGLLGGVFKQAVVGSRAYSADIGSTKLSRKRSRSRTGSATAGC